MRLVIIALLIDIAILCKMFVDTKNTEQVMGVRTGCRAKPRTAGKYLWYAYTYRYNVNDVEYNADDVVVHVVKAHAGKETKIFYKKDSPAHIITMDGIKCNVRTMIVISTLAFCYLLTMAIEGL